MHLPVSSLALRKSCLGTPSSSYIPMMRRALSIEASLLQSFNIRTQGNTENTGACRTCKLGLKLLMRTLHVKCQAMPSFLFFCQSQVMFICFALLCNAWVSKLSRMSTSVEGSMSTQTACREALVTEHNVSTNVRLHPFTAGLTHGCGTKAFSEANNGRRSLYTTTRADVSGPSTSKNQYSSYYPRKNSIENLRNYSQCWRISGEIPDLSLVGQYRSFSGLTK